MDQLLQFFSDEYMPHGHCYLWLPSILWTNVISDLAIALAYFSIPIILLMLIRLRQDIKFKGIFVLFAAFILMCGITHLFGIYTIWHGAYGWHGVAKAITAAVSLATVAALVANRHALLAIPTTEKLEQALVQAEVANITKRDFLAAMSHEIRTPMNGVLGMLHFALKHEQDPLQKKRLESAQKSAGTLLTLINDIIDFSKVEAGKLDIEQVQFNIQSLLKEVMHSFVMQRKNPSIQLILDVSELDVDYLVGDPARIRQILINLLGNAVKFTPQGEVSLTVTLSNPGHGRAELQCIVRDTGIGIADKKIDELFEPFVQGDTSTTRHYGGAGLGLAICNQLAGLMGGAIRASSKLGEGSEFIFSVPVGISEDLSAVSDDRALRLAEMYAGDHSDHTVIAVDQNVRTSQILMQYLKKANYRTLSCKGAEQIAEVLNTLSGHVSLVIDRDALDMMDQAALRVCVQEYSGVIRLYLLDYIGSHPPGCSDLLNDYLDKPLGPQDLFKALQSTVEAVPTAMTTATSTEPPLSASRNTEQPPYAMSVLTAEDNEINQVVINGMLEELVSQQTFVSNGQEALEMLRAHPNAYDVILMDCHMPVMDGYEATQRIRQGEAGAHNSNIYIIAVTANAMAGDRDRCIESGMDDYIAKPIDDSQLKRAIEKVYTLGRSRTHQAPEKNTVQNDCRPNLPENLQAINPEQITNALITRPERLLHALHIFAHDYRAFEAEIKALVRDRNQEHLCTMVHNLKGISGNLGMDRLYQLSNNIHHELKHSRPPTEELLETLIQGCKQALQDAEAIIAANPGSYNN